MSVLCLLRKISAKTPRFVTLDGQLILGATSSGGAYAHPSYGPVTKVEPHRFHGGMSDENVDVATEPWWTEKPERLATEVETVSAAFPGFELIQDEGILAWRGSIDCSPHRFDLVVGHRKDHSLPYVKVLAPSRLGRHEMGRFKKPPHVYLSGNPCVADKDDWNPDRHDMATFICWVAHWIAAYRGWKMTGIWPSVGYEGN